MAQEDPSSAASDGILGEAAAERGGAAGGRKAYLIALIIAQASAFGRSVVLARLIGPEQMGLAAIIVVTAQFFDSITDTGADRFLVQDRHGDTREAAGAVHLVAVSKGILIAVLLLLLAEPIASFTGAPQTAEALRVLAIVPFLNGFTNYDFRVAQRHHQFAPEARVMLVSEVSGLIATAIAAFIVRDFTAVLYGLAVRALAGMLTSQWVASKGYFLRYSKDVALRLWKFCAPLMVNGFCIFLATQSDRVIISRFLNFADLGRYTVVLLLGLYPSLMLMRFISALYLPLIAGQRDDRGEALRIADRLESSAILLGVTIAVGFALVVPTLLPLIFGSRFATSTIVVTLLGLITAWRVTAYAPNTIALATGHTRIVLAIQSVRILGIGLAVFGVQVIGGLSGVALGLLAGELLSNLTAVVLVKRSMHWRFGRSAVRYAFALALGLVLVVRGYALDEGSFALAAAATLVPLALFAAAAWHERQVILQLWKSVPRRARI
jgi:O-antigen/teichoic acid export membrane protein